MEKVARFKEAYEHLKSLGKVHKQKDVSEKMEVSASNISKAFKGDEKYLTSKFLIRFNRTYGNIFNDDWLMTGMGEMLATQQPEKEKIKITLAEMPKLAETPKKTGYSLVDGFSEKLRLLGYEAPKEEKGYKMIALDLAERVNRTASMSEEMMGMISKPLLDRIGLLEKEKAMVEARAAALEAKLAAISIKEAK